MLWPSAPSTINPATYSWQPYWRGRGIAASTGAERRTTRTVSVQQRRRAMVYRHHLGGDADSPEAVTQAIIALHATDPASVYLSVVTRSTGSTLADVSTRRTSAGAWSGGWRCGAPVVSRP